MCLDPTRHSVPQSHCHGEPGSGCPSPCSRHGVEPGTGPPSPNIRIPTLSSCLEGHLVPVDGAGCPTGSIASHGAPYTPTDVSKPLHLSSAPAPAPSPPDARSPLPSPCFSDSCPSCAGFPATQSRTGFWGILSRASAWASCTYPRVSDAMPRLPGAPCRLRGQGSAIRDMSPSSAMSRTCLRTAGRAAARHWSLLLLLPRLPLLLLWDIQAQLRG